LAKIFVDRVLFEEGVYRWHMTDEKRKGISTKKIVQDDASYFLTVIK